MHSIFLKEALLWGQEETLLNQVQRTCRYLHVPFQLFQEVLFSLLSHVELLPFVEEVIIFKRWQVLGLGEQRQC